jgi:3-keto-5-aminohexanoate cleavage enzyme
MPDIRYWAQRMAAGRVVPELEIFEAGMLAAARQLMREGVLNPPCYCNLPLGAQWALPADHRSMAFITAMLPHDMRWSVVHDGMRDFALLATAIGMGATAVRVGFEDSVWRAPGQAARRNADLVAGVVELITAMGGAVASPDEARELLGVTALR